mgnify:CR=1 FL=1
MQVLYRKPRKIVFLMLCLFVGHMVAPGGVWGASYDVNVAPDNTKVMFKESESYDDGYGYANSHLGIKWQPGSARTSLYYQADSSMDIPPEYVEIMTPYANGWQRLNGPVLVLSEDSESAVLRIRISTKVWGPKGEWVTYLRCTNVSGLPLMKIRLEAKDANPGASGPVTLSIHGGDVRIDALTGPATYKAKESITAIVKADHDNWIMKITGEAPTLSDDSIRDPWGDSPVISLEDITLDIKRNGTLVAENRNLVGGISLRPSSETGDQSFEVVVKALTKWETIAGEYRGRLVFTVMAEQ